MKKDPDEIAAVALTPEQNARLHRAGMQLGEKMQAMMIAMAAVETGPSKESQIAAIGPALVAIDDARSAMIQMLDLQRGQVEESFRNMPGVNISEYLVNIDKWRASAVQVFDAQKRTLEIARSALTGPSAGIGKA